MKKFTTLLILSALLLTACSAPASTGSSSEPTSAAGLETSASAESSTQTNTETNSEANADTNTQTPLQAPADITLSKYAVPTVYNDEPADKYDGTPLEGMGASTLGMDRYADAANAVYYIYAYPRFTTATEALDIYRYDKASGENKLVKQLRFEAPVTAYSCVNSDKALYLSYFGADDKWQICEFAFEDNTTRVIKEGAITDGELAPTMTYADGKLTWYTNSGGAADLVIFDIDSRTETAVHNVIPSGGLTAGLAYAVSENGKAVVYDGDRRIETGADSEGFSLAAAQNGLVVWKTADKSGGTNVHFLNSENGAETAYLFERYMGGGIIGRYFYVHTGGDKNVLFYDSADGKQYEITDVGTSWAYPISSDRLGTYSDGVLYIMRAE